jgi:hypothetical protein
MFEKSVFARSHALGVVVGAALLISGCGGGTSMSGGSTAPTSAPPAAAAATGQAMLMLTDAQGDFFSYIVSLTSLQLQTADGKTVETLPASTQVDFTQLVDLSEMLSAGQIPVADYVSAKLTIDYANAQITADDGSGNAVALTPVDANGNAITGTVTVSVQLDSAHHLHIESGHVGSLALDFNLAVSNTVNLNNDTVSVSPTLVANVVPAADKTLRVRGALSGADASQDDFTLNVQPFQSQTSSSGQVTVAVASATTYLINGSSFVGDAGLAALTALPSGTVVAAFGTVTNNAQGTSQAMINATSVLAGSSLQSASEDQFSGTVVARDQTTLTLAGATWSRANGDLSFQMHNTTVLIGAQTTVTEQGQMGTFSVANISVGQHVDAFGSATQGASTTATLDATGGQVRLDVTPVWATVISEQPNSLTLNVQTIDGVPSNRFNFAGTGASTASDASPGSYLVNTGTLTRTGVSVNGQIRVLGFVTPFGSAPPDFNAETLITAPQVTQVLQVQYNHGGSTTAFSGLTASSTSLQLQLPNSNNGNNNNGNGNGNCNNGGPGPSCSGNGSGSGNGDGGGNGGCNGNSGGSGSDNCNNNGSNTNGGQDNDANDNDNNGGNAFVQSGPQQVSLQNTASPLTIVPDQTATNESFTIGHQGPLQSETFSDFPSFVAALANELNGSTAVHAVTANGQYDATSNTFTASQIVVLLTQ